MSAVLFLFFSSLSTLAQIYIDNNILESARLNAKFDDWRNLLKFVGPPALATGPLAFEWVSL